jgi:hypothetical protein
LFIRVAEERSDMRIPQTAERIKEAPAQALRAVFAGVGQVLLITERVRRRSGGDDQGKPAGGNVATAEAAGTSEAPAAPEASAGTGETVEASAAESAGAVGVKVSAPKSTKAAGTKVAGAKAAGTKAAGPKAAGTKAASAKAAGPKVAGTKAASAKAAGTKAAGAKAAGTKAAGTRAKAVPAEAPAAEAPKTEAPAAETPAPASPEVPASAEASTPTGGATSVLPVPHYSQLSIASLRARMRGLDVGQVRDLLNYERTHEDRENVVTMFERRIAKLLEEAGDTGTAQG